MLEVINLALPFFGLILIGFAAGKYKPIPDSALDWMNFFIVYVALPALFFRILSQTPFEELARPHFIVATTLGTFCAFVAAFGVAMAMRRKLVTQSTIAALAGSYGNIGYMGPGLALATLGQTAAVPVALIFCFDTLLLFSLVPFLMAFADPAPKSTGEIARDAVVRIALNPLVIATLLGIAAAAFDFQPPTALERLFQFLQNAAAPCALFTLGVTVALRPLERVPWEVPPLIVIKLVLHPIFAFLLLSVMGTFDQTWVSTAILMAALPPALNVYVFARQYDSWIEQASSSVLFGTLASVVTLTTVMWLAKTGKLPQLLFH
ncbi:MAG: AEC family transporter [Pseudolabrys sp.]|nr:AEC family transporter [Pseudolabrys sp.]MBV9955492.1 AEC family transporter [Pseudolabrys sp.]